MIDVSLLVERCPPEAAGEPACRACTILLEPTRPGRPPVVLSGSLGIVCGVCYETMSRHMARGMTLAAALAAATWGTDDF